MENIQPPSFNDFKDGVYTNYVSDDKATPNNNFTSEINNPFIQESQINYAYDIPVSILKDGVWQNLFSMSLLFSAIIFVVILYCIIRTAQIRIAERERFESEPMSPEAELLLGHKEMADKTSDKNLGIRRWNQIQAHTDSENENDWRLAIIEADIMLDEVISSLNVKGDNLGDRLKSLQPKDLNSVEEAWEAHKTRNKIAHEGSSYELNKREVKRVIGLYEKVFRELGYIR